MHESKSKLEKPDLRFRFVKHMYLAFFVDGVVLNFTQHQALMVWIPSLYIGTYATFWVISDAKTYGHSVPHIAQMIMLSLWAVLIPAYLVLTRGFRGILLAMLHLVTIALTSWLGAVFGEFAICRSDLFRYLAFVRPDREASEGPSALLL